MNLREGLEEIGYGAFQGCSSLNDIFIPPTVKVIKDEAFFDCLQRTTVNHREGLEEIGAMAFSCTSIHSIICPPAVKEIGVGTFQECRRLRGITIPPVVVKEIEKDTYRKCSWLTTVNLGKGLEKIEREHLADACNSNAS